mgnify:CR=1 FL=1
MKTVKFDLFGSPIKPRPKCKNCGKDDNQHKAVTRECPLGTKHRTLGYSSYGRTVFEAKKP